MTHRLRPYLSSALCLLALGLAAGATAGERGHYRHHHHGHHGHHGHGHSHGSLGIYFGAPWRSWGPAYYVAPPPVYYTPPRVVVVPPPQPPVYIEQTPGASDGQYWYYCSQAGAYYPQVSDCPGGWLRIPPRP